MIFYIFYTDEACYYNKYKYNTTNQQLNKHNQVL